MSDTQQCIVDNIGNRRLLEFAGKCCKSDDALNDLMSLFVEII